MTFDQLWQIIYDKNPTLRKGRAIMSTDNFRKALKQAYEQGQKSVSHKGADNPFTSFFGGRR